MANTKPFVALACFCENILEDKDGVLSAIRIVDTYSLPPLPEGAQLQGGLLGAIMLNGLVTIKSGDVRGSGTLSLVMHRPVGDAVTISPPGGWPVVLNGGEHGFNLKIQMPLGVKNFGLLWFDVIWNGETLTRIPLRLQQGPPLEQTTGGSPS